MGYIQGAPVAVGSVSGGLQAAAPTAIAIPVGKQQRLRESLRKRSSNSDVAQAPTPQPVVRNGEAGSASPGTATQAAHGQASGQEAAQTDRLTPAAGPGDALRTADLQAVAAAAAAAAAAAVGQTMGSGMGMQLQPLMPHWPGAPPHTPGPVLVRRPDVDDCVTVQQRRRPMANTLDSGSERHRLARAPQRPAAACLGTAAAPVLVKGRRGPPRLLAVRPAPPEQADDGTAWEQDENADPAAQLLPEKRKQAKPAPTRMAVDHRAANTGRLGVAAVGAAAATGSSETEAAGLHAPSALQHQQQQQQLLPQPQSVPALVAPLVPLTVGMADSFARAAESLRRVRDGVRWKARDVSR